MADNKLNLWVLPEWSLPQEIVDMVNANQYHSKICLTKANVINKYKNFVFLSAGMNSFMRRVN